MKKQILLSLVVAGSLIATAHAQEESQQSNTSTLKASEVQKSEEKVGGDIDNEITNAKMRADSGSKSKWSLSADLTYAGGNLEAPFSDVRPNYSGDASANSITSIDGTIAASLRLDKNQRLSFGTGVTLNTPFQSTGEEMLKSSENGGSAEVATPYLSWKYSGRIGKTQNSLSVSYYHATSNYDTNALKISGYSSISHVVILDIEGSNWQPGLSTSFLQMMFTEENQKLYQYQIGFYPFVEYAFNDTYSFRTVFRPFTYDHYESMDFGTFKRNLYTQSLGLGIAVARDLYLYPNMQFAPENLSPDLTNVGLSMTANIF